LDQQALKVYKVLLVELGQQVLKVLPELMDLKALQVQMVQQEHHLIGEAHGLVEQHIILMIQFII
jgi:hypothetical protein